MYTGDTGCYLLFFSCQPVFYKLLGQPKNLEGKKEKKFLPYIYTVIFVNIK